MTKRCERGWESDALRDGRLSASDAESFARHCAACEDCRAQQQEDERLRALGRALAQPHADALAVRRLRYRILRAAAAQSRPRAPWYAAVAATIALVAVVAAGWTLLRARVTPAPAVAAAPATPFGADIEADTGASWSSRVDGETERVKLVEGALTLQVRHREPGERFIVELPDGEIEVRGTRFRVAVTGGKTRGIRVIEGVVALRLTGTDGEVVLRAGESWAPAIAIAPVPVAAAAPSASARPAPAAARAHVAPAPSGGATSGYEEAVALFESGRYEEAARQLHDYVGAYPRAAEAEDAAFLEATALARAGRSDAAAAVAERFLDRYASSVHTTDAATLAVRGARDRGDCARAHALAQRWIASTKSRAAVLGACAGPGSVTGSPR